MTKGDNNTFKAVLKKYFRKEDVLLVPNILCYFRIILVVIFLVVYLLPENILPNPLGTTYIAIAILVTAAYTDFVVGFIARRFNQISNPGKVLDPIADK
jgi:cardiolipin synthase